MLQQTLCIVRIMYCALVKQIQKLVRCLEACPMKGVKVKEVQSSPVLKFCFVLNHTALFQMSSYEPCAAAGPGAAASLRAERSALRGSGPSPGGDGVGRPWRGVLQVRLFKSVEL